MTVSSLDLTLDIDDQAAIETAMYRICGKLKEGTLASHRYFDLVQNDLGSIPVGRKRTISTVAQRSSRDWPSDAVYSTAISRYTVGAKRYEDKRTTDLSRQSSIEIRNADFQIDTWLPDPATGRYRMTYNDTRYTLTGNTLTLTVGIPEDDLEPLLMDSVPVSPEDAEDMIYRYSIQNVGNGQIRIQSP